MNQQATIKINAVSKLPPGTMLAGRPAEFWNKLLENYKPEKQPAPKPFAKRLSEKDMGAILKGLESNPIVTWNSLKSNLKNMHISDQIETLVAARKHETVHNEVLKIIQNLVHAHQTDSSGATLLDLFMRQSMSSSNDYSIVVEYLEKLGMKITPSVMDYIQNKALSYLQRLIQDKKYVPGNPNILNAIRHLSTKHRGEIFKKIDIDVLLCNAILSDSFSAAEELIRLGANVNSVAKKVLTSSAYSYSKNYGSEFKIRVAFLIDNGAMIEPSWFQNYKEQHKTIAVEQRYLKDPKYAHYMECHVPAGAYKMRDVRVIVVPGQPVIDHAAYEFHRRRAEASAASERWAKERAEREAKECIIGAVKHPDLKFIKTHLHNHADPNELIDGKLPLCVAVKLGATEMVKFLIENGANVNLKDADGETALSLAISSKLFEETKLLVERGANVNTQVAGKETPLGLAISSKSYEMTKLLIEHGANINMLSGGNIPLHDAIKTSKIDMVKLLVENGANVNLKDADGETALSLAISYNLFEEAKLLVERGANVNTQVAGKETPLGLAISSKSYEMTKLLIEHGADTNMLSDGNIPLHDAIQSDWFDIATLLIEHGAKVTEDTLRLISRFSLKKEKREFRRYLLTFYKAENNGGGRDG